MGISAWIWFVVAAVALVAGLGLLFADRAKEGSRNRERMRWAQLRGWQFVEEDERLPRQWSSGAIGYFGADAAVNVVAGSTFTSDGRRPVFIFDIESQGQIPAVVVAVRCNKTHRVPVEMWLSSVPFQREDMPEMLGPIGQRYAFADDAEGARQVITQDLVDAADQLGGDVGVAWLENEWVLASVVPGAGPSRLERLLRDLGEIADIVDPFDEDYDTGRTWTPAGGTPAPATSAAAAGTPASASGSPAAGVPATDPRTQALDPRSQPPGSAPRPSGPARSEGDRRLHEGSSPQSGPRPGDRRVHEGTPPQSGPATHAEADRRPPADAGRRTQAFDTSAAREFGSAPITQATSPSDTHATAPVEAQSPADTRATERQPSPPEPRTPSNGPSTHGSIPAQSPEKNEEP
ncbi:hypothetical protein BJY18_004916 [Amycolatopsis jiangsuensis]|uniref:Secreted protein n=1 Tax=Amycolatopsis jiangsuensis TaxID=1181879 RepID=A0A840IX89_9PSEU|nr:hypothetical protein [Amycolatopsis jiangsuensis]